MTLIKRSFIFTTAVIVTATASAQVMQKAPDFTAVDANGTTHTLSQYKGKVVVLEFTNPGSPVTGQSGCPYMVARYEHKTMQNLANKTRDQGAVYLAVNSNSYNTVADTKAIADKYNVTFPTLLDNSGTIARAYHAKTSPDMYVINKTGQIVYQGALDSNSEVDTAGEATATHYVEEAVTAAVAGKIPTTTKTKPYGCGLKLK